MKIELTLDTDYEGSFNASCRINDIYLKGDEQCVPSSNASEQNGVTIYNVASFERAGELFTEMAKEGW